MIDPILCKTLSTANIRHGFFTRSGGVSSGIYKGLNVGLGSGDNRENVLENRRKVAAFFDVEEGQLATPYQIHSADVLEIKQPLSGEERPRIDAFVTANPQIVIGILTADCGPVLFADPNAGVIGAAHAGWKGATAGILENTIQSMEKIGASRGNIIATLGPTISGKNYEVGLEFIERLQQLDAQNSEYLSPSENKTRAMFDLPRYIVDRLEKAGVTASWTGHCTYENEAQFFSYRRKTHREEADYGRQISAISLQI